MVVCVKVGAINTTWTPVIRVNHAKWSRGWREGKLVQSTSIFKNATSIRQGMQDVSWPFHNDLVLISRRRLLIDGV